MPAIPRFRAAAALLAPLALATLVTACGGSDDDVAAPAPPAAQIASLKLLGSTAIPTGTLFEGVEFGGISGLDRAADGSFRAISDDRGGERGTPRFYTLAIDHDAAGAVSVQVLAQQHMLREDGTPFPATARTVDPEAIRFAPNGNLYWSSEGNWAATEANRFQPFVREMKPDGGFVRQFAVPPMYQYVDNATTGARSNKLFEALAVTPDGTVYAANEDALIQDGPLTTVQAGSVVRVTAFDPGTGQPRGQYVYALPPIPVDAAPGAPFGPDNGLSELIALGDRQFIAVERAFASGVGNTIRLVITEVQDGTTDVSGIEKLAGATFMPMSRRVLLEMPLTFQGVKLDNIEGIAWGRTLANGNRTLVLVADNNFTAETQTTQFIVLEVVMQ